MVALRTISRRTLKVDESLTDSREAVDPTPRLAGEADVWPSRAVRCRPGPPMCPASMCQDESENAFGVRQSIRWTAYGSGCAQGGV